MIMNKKLTRNKLSIRKTPAQHLPQPLQQNKLKSNDSPQWVFIKSIDDQRPLSRFNVFAKKKAIDGISREIEKIKMLRDGNLLVQTKSQKIADQFMKIKNFGGFCPVLIRPYNGFTINSYCKGTIYDRNLIDASETEILDSIKSQGVVAVYKFTKISSDHNRVPTGVVLLTFDLKQLPSQINIAWYSVKIREFYPNPMRCKNCQLFGHTMKFCRNQKLCEICNHSVHETNKCERIQCANCFGNHPSSSNKCPKYKEVKEILKIMVKNKCKMNEARQLYNQKINADKPEKSDDTSDNFNCNESIKHNIKDDRNESFSTNNLISNSHEKDKTIPMPNAMKSNPCEMKIYNHTLISPNVPNDGYYKSLLSNTLSQIASVFKGFLQNIFLIFGCGDIEVNYYVFSKARTEY